MFKTISTLSQEVRTEIDTDGDGTPDRFEVDTDGNGTIDRIEFDPDQDGNIDRIAHLDEDGRWVQVDRDLDDDGTIDRITHYAFDSGTRRVTRREVDLDDDGTIDRSEAYIYDGANRVRIDFDLDNDGLIDRTARLNAEGRWERVERDVDDDGFIDRITHFAFDGDGNRSVTRRDEDLDDDGNIDRTIHLNAEGRWERVEWDDDDDGTIDRTVHRNTDTGAINRIDFDDDGDGTTDRSEFYTQNADGNRDRANFDDDADGTIDRSETYTYDANDRVSQTNFDDDNDGTTDRSESYTYDANDRVSQASFDDDNDGTTDRSESYTYDANDRVSQTSFDDDNDGTTDRIESYSYDLNGNLIRTEFDDDADGIIERAENYDLNGNLIRTEIDTDNDGVLDRTEIDLNNDGNPERVEIRNPSGQLVREEIDNLSDGTPNRVNYYWYPEDLDGDRDPFRQDDDTDGDGDLDRVSYEGDADFAGDFPNHAGLEVVRLGFVGRGDGFTTLTIPDGFVFAGASGSQVRIEGGSTDTLRFDMDDFTEGDRVIIEGQDYRSFAANDGSWSFLVDADVTLIDPTPNFTSPATANARENQTAAYMAAATDADGDTLVYSLSGTDAALFTINATTGEVSFIEAPDFEAPGDDGGDNVYDIIVTASDGTNSTNHNVAITVTNENDNIPVFTSPAAANAQENQTAAYMAAATDADGDTLVYSLSGTDAALFTIDANTGEVSFIEAPDFEAPGDDGGDNVYDIIVTASDGTNSTDHNVAITVTNENDNIPVFTSPATANARENQAAAYMAAATDADGDTLVYSLSGTDAALFTIDANTGEVSFIEAPDFEAPGDDGGDNVYDIIVTASDGANSTDHNVAITVTNENDNIPVFTSPATANAQENQTAAYMAAATDADGDTLVYSLSGTDAALFTINATTGEVSFIEAPDFEAPGDDGGDNVYDIIVTASDGTNSTNHNVAITVTNENDNIPVFTSPAAANAQENQTAAYMAAATDADGDTLVYSLSGTDAALFTIDANTGEVSFIEAPDFEAPGDDGGDNVYDIIVTASDGTTDTEQAVAITVTNDNDNIPVFTSPAAANAQENQTAAYMAAATDADGDTLVYSLSGTDAALFTIDANTGEVSFMAAPDFEAPGDDGGDNVYDIIVTASDGENNTNHNVAITVTNENDNIPVFTSPAAVSAQENQTAAYMAAATDADGDALVYSLSGTDAARFTIDADTGEVRFREAPDFEAPGDDDRDNVYDIIVTASDGTNRTDHNVAITVTNENDNIPAFTSPAAANAQENQTAAYMAAATDADGDTLVYSLSGTDAARFTIDAATGEVSFIEAPDFEVPGDDGGDNVYDIIVTASDGTNSTDHNVAITVTNENDNIPVFTSPATANAQENQTVAYMAAATDADGDTLVYSLSGTDAALFTIDANTGEVSFIEAPDFEAPGDDGGDNVYDIIVTASDGANSTDHNVAITVTNENDNIPVFTSPATANAQENQTAAYMAAATDADGDTLVYSLSGTDAALFTIDADTGEVRFREAPDFEAPGDDDRDNVYDIIVTASDGTNRTDHNVAITVTNENDNIPVFTSPATANAQENQTAAYMAAATDADGDTLVYSLSGTDSALFTIDAATGEVSFITVPDFEVPGDDGGDNVYDIIVTASDGENNTNHDVAITVTNENDNIPAFTSPATANAQENQTAAYMAAATDADGDTLVYSLSGTDSALFTIDAATGEVSFIEAPDFEVPGDDGGDNVYDIIVTASDGENNTNHDVAITVTNENDNIPVFTSPATANAQENQTAAYEAAATDADGNALVYSLSGTDAARFTIDANTGEVSFMAAPDFEAPGDDDRDNVYDIIVIASDGENNTNHNVAITVTDEYDLVPLSTLDGTNGFILNGIDSGDQSGFSVSSAGDVNGDGYDDLIIGAYRADPNGDSSGETYVVYGGASAPGTGGVLDLSDLDGTNGFILTGIDAYDQSGFSVSSAGDVNGDGYDDLIIGARVADPNGNSSAGETYIVYGGASAPGTGGVLDLSALDGTNGFILNGIDAYDRSGRSVSSAGDVNGDGYDDLIIGASSADPNGDSSAGETYIVYGGASAPGTEGRFNLSTLNGSNGFILTGIDDYDGSGRSVSSAGDVNGDGYDDLIIGASGADPNGDSSGETYIVYGGASAPGTDGVLDLGALNGTNGFILNGIDGLDRSGISVSSAGDVNGDGYDDLIIGAFGAEPNGDSSAGETYIVYGGASAPGTNGVLDLSALDGTNGFILNGIDAGDLSGRSVSSAGDVNGDGYDDLIIGANRADPNGDSAAGETYIVYGGASAPGTEGVLDLSDLDGTNGFILTGIDAYDQSGIFVSSAGDVNGDGYDDLIIGANRADGYTGETYVLYGGATGTESLTPVTASGTAAADNFTGNAGADSFTDIATDDVVRGGAGDDTIRVTSLDFVAIDGGTGQDTLVLEGAGLSLDLTGAGHAGVDSVELFDLSGTGANSLVLDALAVFGVTEEREGGAASLDVLGDADDRVDLGGSNFALTGTAAEDGVTYNVYSNGNAQLRIETGVQVVSIPVFTSPATANAQENQTAAYEAAAADADGDTLVYSLSGTDAALFTIDAATGEVSFITAPDFEAPGDDDGDNVYDIIVTASDGENNTNHNVAITVTNENDNIPIFTSPATANVRENQTAAYMAAATDADGDTLVYSLSGTDAARFTIDANTGEVRFRAAPDFEAPGDDGGDNVYDITVTASDGTTDTEQAVAITVTDVNEFVPLSSLDGSNGFILNGIDGGDSSGFSVSSAGDVNGDGYDDLIIGARYADPNGNNSAGETYVVYGGASAPGTGGVLDLSDLDGTNGFILNGIDANDFSGWSVSSAGDVNGDGYDDLIIGANRADPNGDSEAGETYVIYGGASAPGTGGVLDLSDLDGTNGFTLTGIDARDRSGVSVSSAGDVNGDGYDDLVIGAYYGANRAGETYVVYGGASAPGTDGVLDLSALDGTNGFILSGIDAADQSGFSVSSAGDVNGDGYDDLVIGARNADPNGSNSGETYIIYGGASAPGTDGVLDLSTLDGSNGFILNGIDANDASGWSVSSAGDVNGDGYDDLIIGAYRADPNGNSSGETYVVYGGASAPGAGGMLDLSALDGTNGFILNGIDANDNSGISVSSAGDINGDGYDDLIIGANRADPNGINLAGETYVIYGGANAPGTAGVLNLSDLDGNNGFTLAGIGAGDLSGRSVSSAGDVNGDGYDDLVIGAPGGFSETYVIYGGATGTESLTPVTAQGTAAADNFTGNAGADSFTGIATDDVVRGGDGDDRISVTALDFAAIDGGTGADTLVLDGAGLALDLIGTGHAGVDSVEVFDLSGTGANSLVLDAQAVFDVTEEREGGAASLDVLGDADDRVDLSGSNFVLSGTATEDGVTYNVYRDGNAQLRIEDGVQVQNPRLITLSVAEGQIAARYRAPDAEGSALVYSLSGTDAALFTIDANTGEVRFREAPDFEAPGDADGDNVYDIIATVSDGTNHTEQVVAIRVTNENDNAPVFTSPARVDAAENQFAAYEAAATDADGDMLRYSLSGTDAALFTIDANTGEVRFREAPDFEAPGDDGGDNVYDIVVTASDGSNHTEQAVAITVTDGYDPDLTSLDGSNGFILNGIDAADFSGFSVSSAGDVNGDGYDDLIIGAYRADPNGDSDAGETYVVYGGANAPGTGGRFNLSDLDGTNGFILAGIDTGDYSGRSVSSAGDVNGDGYDDLIIGANRADPNGDNQAGETYIVYGGASAPGRGGVLDLSMLDGTNGFILTGIDAYDRSGSSVSSAGDVNGDGYDDLIIGAYYGADNYAGETYVIYGGASAPGTDGVLDRSDLDGSNGFILTGINAADQSGFSVSSAGDVNGDGYDDLVIGASHADPNGGNSGETYVIYGGANAPGTAGVLDLSDLDGSNGFILTGIDGADVSGWSVSSAGDVNGDGYDDLVIGAWGADPNGDSGAGETYVVYGGANAPGTRGRFNLSMLDGTNGFILTGIDVRDYSGISVSSAGDVNGDGYDDLIIGANRADPNGDINAGETYIVYGGASAPGSDGVLDLSSLVLDGSTGFIVNGIDARDYSGSSVSSAGDVNGDGYDDLIIGAREADPNGDNAAGETYIIYGGATGTESLTPVTASGTAAADNFTGNAGADSFTAIATDDVVRGAAGDDRISVTALDFAAIDGGTGVDTLVLDGAGLALDLTGPGNAGVDSVELFDLSGTGTNSLVLDAQAVFDVTEEREGGVARLDVLGDADDSVDLSGSSFALSGTVTEDGVTYNVYRDGNAQVRVETGVQVQNPRLITLSVAEGQIATRYRAPDVEGETLVYSLSGTDAALFTIDANTGEVRFREAPDFEAPGDGDGDNVYDIIATVSDGTTETGQAVAIRVTNENDIAPVFTSPARGDAAENQVAAYEAVATDADGDTLVYSLSGTDAALFTIDANRGEVRFREAPDFEVPGDDGGDNVYDIVVTASDGSNHTEQAVAITVTDGYDPDLASLDGSNGFILTGIDRNDFSGFSVSSAGDVNGDGYDDLVIGAYRADPNGGDSGETYVVYGGASAPGTGGELDLSSLDGSNGFILNGIDAGDQSGWSVSSAGDVNGDGYDDLIIGARSADPNGDSNAGETYIVYGGASAPGTNGELDLSMLDGTNGFILNGIDTGDRSGWSVSSAGDVNGDGYDDLLIGASYADPNGNGSGETYVVYGGPTRRAQGGVLDLGALDGTNGFILNGNAFDYSGWSVSSAGDVNGDGYDDLIIGAYWADGQAGKTYVVYGGASAPGSDGMLDLSTLDGTNGFTLNGIDLGDQSGRSVSSAGDVNGDGYDDLVIGAHFADPNGNSSGETYIIYGGARAPGTGGRFNLSTLNGSNGFILTGIDANDQSGFSVSSAGDVNGDGYDDLIIGARWAAPNGDSNAGETYILYGGANAPGSDGVLDLSSLALDGSTGFIVNGIDAYDYSGISVSSAGDVNGDGYDDLIIGADRADPNGRNSAGESYVLYGGATGTESLTPVTASGTAAADNFTGNAGADSFTAIATDDVVRGGAGNDNISVTALDFAAIDGGTGADRLVLDGAGLALDLTGPGNAGVDSVEIFDLSGTGANSLVLDALAVFDVTEEREGGVASLDVLGDADDRVDLGGGNFILTGTATEDGVTYNIYRDGNAQLRVEDGVSVTLAAAGGAAQSAESKTDPKTDPKTDTGIDPVADLRTDLGFGTIRLDGALINPDPLMNSDLWNDDLWNNDLWDDLWVDEVKSLDQPVHMDEDAILIPLSDPLSFGPLASGPLAGPWGDLMCWPGLESHPAMQNDLAMILPEMEIVTAYMEGF